MIDAFVIAAALILFRVAAFVTFLPPVAGQGIPGTVRIGLAVAVTVVLAPTYVPSAALLLEVHSSSVLWARLTLWTMRETALGAGLAWFFGLSLVPARVAGAWIAQEMGLTIGGLTSPLDQQPGNVFSWLLEALAVMFFFVANLHHVLFWSLGRSFDAHRVGGGFVLPRWDATVSEAARTIDDGLLIAAPVGIVLFVTLVVLLVTMKTAPHFNFMSYGMTLRLIAGLVGVFLLFPELFCGMQVMLNRLQETSVF